MRGTYAKTAGRHNVKGGYEWLGLYILVDDTNPLYGIDAFGGAFSRPAANVPAGVNNSWYQLADFYTGARSSYQLATQVNARVRQRGNFFFVQDDWKATRKLTLNAGLRYDLMTPVFDADNRLANFDPSTNKLVTASDSDRSLQRQPKNNFAPRLGAAYQVDDKTVVRGGYGLGWNFWNRMASAELMNTNAPFVTRFSTTNSAANLGNICTGSNYLAASARANLAIRPHCPATLSSTSIAKRRGATSRTGMSPCSARSSPIRLSTWRM